MFVCLFIIIIAAKDYGSAIVVGEGQVWDLWKCGGVEMENENNYTQKSWCRGD